MTTTDAAALMTSAQERVERDLLARYASVEGKPTRECRDGWEFELLCRRTGMGTRWLRAVRVLPNGHVPDDSGDVDLDGSDGP